MKTISIVVPCYNEEENVEALSQAIIATFEKDLPAYGYEPVSYTHLDVYKRQIKWSLIYVTVAFGEPASSIHHCTSK